MKIIQIELYQSPIKLKEPFVISLGPLYYAENIIVVIRTDEGITGFGECSPFMTINGESMETCYIVGQYLARVLVGKDPLQLETCAMLMDGLIYANSSIKSAFDIALHDIAAQHAGLPLYGFLGGKNDKELRTDYTISIGPVTKMVADGLSIKARGFKIIKIKLGGTKEDDIERVRSIREAIGAEIPLRIDANQGWNTKDAIAILKALVPYNIQHCEEPVPRWNFMELSNVRKESPIPIMADESCCDHHDAQRLVDLKACNLFNIKLGKSSGFVKAQKIVQIAEREGINIQVGGFLESRLGFTASAHLALTSSNILHCDFDTPMMFVEDPVEGGITYGEGGVIAMPDKPGLGASVDEQYLRKLTHIIVA
jgi:L-alanine-DL-glutamate epimerase-like enolase superfamily enzyme